MQRAFKRFPLLGLTGLLLPAISATAQTKLYWTMTDGTGAYVVRADANGANPVTIVSGIANVKGPNGLEAINGQLYWPDQQLNAVKQANPDGSGVTAFTSASNPYDVCGTATQIYWTSQTGNYIDTQSTNGTGYQRLFDSATVTSPFAIEVTADYIYWSEVSGQGRIRRSDLNGGNVITLIPNVFVYDLQVTSNYLYFADINYPSGALKRANLDGTGITNLVTGAFGGVDLINGLCVTTNYIYWSEYNTFTGGGIRRASLGGTGRVDLYNALPGSGIRGVVLLPEVAAPTPPPVFTSATKSLGGFAFTLQTEIGRTYRIETSSNFTNWTEITNFTSAATSISFTNPIPPGATNLFYRARTP